MHDAAIVRGLQRRGDRRARSRSARACGSGPSASSSRSVRPSRYSEAMNDLIADLFERIHRGDRRMRQRRGGARFLPQARAHAVVAEQMRRQRLQRDRRDAAACLRE